MRQLTILFFLACSLCSTAQTKFKPGVRAGANFANITSTGFSARTDFYVSGLGELRLGSVYALQPEFSYSRQGAKGAVIERSDATRTPVANEIVTNYVSFGAMNKFYLSDFFNVMIGPTLDQEMGQSPVLRRYWDATINVGIEFKTPFGLGIEARMKRGTIDLINSNKFETIGNRGWFNIEENANIVIQAGLTYYFGTNKKQ